MLNNTPKAETSPGDAAIPAQSKGVFMALFKGGSSTSADDPEPDVAIKIEPVFDPVYKPSLPGDARTVMNVMQFHNCQATAFAVHDRIIAVGSSTGRVILADPLGNVDHKVNVFHLHARAVVTLDIDSSGEFVASGGEDGRVVVLDLALTASSKNQQIMQLSHDRPVRSVALDPDFHRARDRRIIVASGGRILLYLLKKASLFSSSDPQQTVLVDGVILMTNIAWQPSLPTGSSSLIAWANERGDVVLYDERKRANAGLIRPEPAQIIAATSQTNKVSASFSTSVSWLPINDSNNSSSIMVVCGSLLRLFRITGGDDPRGADIVTPRVVHLTHRIPLSSDIAVDAVIASVGSSASMNYAACCINQPYQLILCSIGNFNGQPVPQPTTYPFPSSDDLVSMASLPHDRQTYVLTKSGSMYAVKISSLLDDDSQAILTEYVDYLLTIGDASAAASQLPRVFDSKKKKSNNQRISWEEWLGKFDQLGQIPAVAAYLPSTKPAANSGISVPSKDRYDMVLSRVLAHSPSQFEALLYRLSPELYSTDAVMALVSEALNQDPRNRHLLASLAFLCCNKQQFDRAVNLLLELRHESLFKIVAENSLYHLLQKRVSEFVGCGSNPDVVVDILINHTGTFPVNSVIAQLKNSFKTQRSSPMALFSYLKRMLTVRSDDLQQADIDLLVTLYADLDPDGLLTFLRSTDAYRLENALAECRQRKRHRECVYLLGKGGKMLEAIDLIIKELGSVEEAVDFCREKGGSSNHDLWMVLAERVVTHRPNMVAELLRLTGTELLDPAEVIKLIPTSTGRLVPGLRQALEGSLSDSERQLTLLSSAKKVVGNDLSQVFKQITTSAFSATVVVDDKAQCQECHEALSNAHSAALRLVVFTCRHAFHYACLTNADDANCPVCGKLKERSTTGGTTSSSSSTNLASASRFLTGQQHASMPTLSASPLGSSLPLSSPLSQFSGLLSGLSKTTVRS